MKKYAFFTIECNPKFVDKTKEVWNQTVDYIPKRILISYKSKTLTNTRVIYNKCSLIAKDDGLDDYTFKEDYFFDNKSPKKLYPYFRLLDDKYNFSSEQRNVSIPWKEFKAERIDDAKLLFEISKGEEKNEK